MKSRVVISLVFLVLLAVGFYPSFSVFAQSNVPFSDVQAFVKQLQEQIKMLQEQIKLLQLQLAEMKKEVEAVKLEVRFQNRLQPGMSGEKVRRLQEFLKQFPSIYPEGFVTGYFGPLTKVAVKRFQETYANEILAPLGLQEGTGIVGEKTITKLNEVAKAIPAVPAQVAVPSESSAIPASPAVPPEKREPEPEKVAPPQETPSGTTPAIPAIPAKPATPTQEPATPATLAIPAVPIQPSSPPAPQPTADIKANSSDGSITIAYNTAAIITWTSTYATSCVISPNGWNGLSGSQSTGSLTSSTTYTVSCTNSQGSVSDSVQINVSAPPQAQDTTPPVISNVSVTNISSTGATIIWTTDELSDTRVEYGTSASYGASSALDANLTTSHSVSLLSLQPATLYHFRIKSTDAARNLGVSTDQTFTTPASPDTNAPVISDVQATNITYNSVAIIWSTNETADSQVEYGATASYGNETTLASSLVTSHSASLSNLQPSTIYHYRVKSKDASGNPAVSQDYIFTTLAMPVTISPPITQLLITLSVGSQHTCVVLEDKTVKCWGLNNTGQVGNGTDTHNIIFPVSVINLTNVISVSAGAQHTCALLEDKTVKCWGSVNALGAGSTSTNSTIPVLVSGLANVVSISAEGFHTCALLEDKTVKCWGDNYYGQLGDGTNTERRSPVPISNLANVVSVSAGIKHTCALLEDKTVKCWGQNLYGQFGDGTYTSSNIPVPVPNLTNVASISMGPEWGCAVLGDRTAKCWGYNAYGWLGNGTNQNSNVPVSVSNLTNIIALNAGGAPCALLEDKTVKCWGSNVEGELGTGTNITSYTPVPVSNLTNIVSINTGGSHACTLLKDKTVKCWGHNGSGQLGTGNLLWSNVPVPVINLGPIQLPVAVREDITDQLASIVNAVSRLLKEIKELLSTF